ncbi:MAG: TIGR00366 family protein [Clostridiales bacterium]|nr:TIGR00366 family protein [Clostridiales bacterium]MDD7034705.1 TIGR00366 family protein [Bacillota bacterium]MDY2919667.1 TIGR00366 family protein [Lentihominibacter sp.]
MSFFKKNKEGEQLQDVHEVKSVNPMVILACIIILAAIATYVVPAGTFDRVPIEGTDYEGIVQGSYHYVDNSPIAPFDVFVSFTKGLQNAAYIIFFLLILGGVFKIVETTGALHAGINNMIKATAGKEVILVPICLIVFSLISATAACCEEYLAFLPLMYMVCMGCGFDSILAVGLLFCSSAVGYAGGMTQAFSVGVAQTIAGLPMFSGIGFRTVGWAVLVTATIIYMMIYAHKIKKDPSKAYNFEIDKKYRAEMDFSTDNIAKLTGRQAAVLAVFFAGFVFAAFSVIKLGFYIDEMSAIFLIVGIICAIIGGVGPGRTADAFAEGAKDLVWAGLIIGLCYAATTILQDAQIMDTIVNAMGEALKGLHSSVAAVGMFVLQDVLNFLIPSGSGQAAITMPFMAPLADVLGVTRQTAVLAFQYGDAFTNVISPTSGEIMAALAICHVPYGKWFKFMWKLWVIWAVLACILLVVASMIGYN